MGCETQLLKIPAAELQKHINYCDSNQGLNYFVVGDLGNAQFVCNNNAVFNYQPAK